MRFAPAAAGLCALGLIVTAPSALAAQEGAVPTDEMVETFTIRWEPHGEGMGHLVMEWENTRVDIPIHQAGMGH